MLKIAVVVTVSLLALTGCLKENNGLAVGVQFKDCAKITSNMRQGAAVLVKGLSREDSVKVLSANYNITESEASDCLK